MPESRIESIRYGRVLVVRLQGDLDVATAPTVREEVDARWLAGGGHLLLDLSQVTFLDSTGLGVILGRYRRSQQVGGRMALSGVPSAIMPTLRLSGIYQLMAVYPSEQEALAALEGVAL